MWNEYYVENVQTLSFFWSVLLCIRTEYGDLQTKSPYSIQKRDNTDQKKSLTYIFHALEYMAETCILSIFVRKWKYKE